MPAEYRPDRRRKAGDCRHGRCRTLLTFLMLFAATASLFHFSDESCRPADAQLKALFAREGRCVRSLSWQMIGDVRWRVLERREQRLIRRNFRTSTLPCAARDEEVVAADAVLGMRQPAGDDGGC